jgi:hypothetical protein
MKKVNERDKFAYLPDPCCPWPKKKKMLPTYRPDFLLSQIDYCNSLLFGCFDHLTDKLQLIMNNGPAWPTTCSYHTNPRWSPLATSRFKDRLQDSISPFSVQRWNCSRLRYLKELLLEKNKHKYNTRSSMDTSTRELPLAFGMLFLLSSGTRHHTRNSKLH